MIEVNDSQVIFGFSGSHAPIARVAPGEQVRIRTQDCFSNQLQVPEDSIDALDWDRVNPATGPIYVEGARPGDVLKVKIERIELDSQAAMATGEDEGTMGDRFHDGLVSTLKPIRDGKLVWNERLSIPLKPMIGVIGVAPAGDQAISCGTPDSHGGNMDNTMVGEGATLYFPVAHEGALFGCGDLHAVMGDGEIGVSGAEIAGFVTVTFEVLSDRSLANPVLTTDEVFTTIASAKTLDEAADRAVHDMVDLIVERGENVDEGDLVMLLSLVADVQVCQIVDPQKTARFAIPWYVLDSLGFRW